MTGTEPASPAGDTNQSGAGTEVRWLRLAQTVLTIVVVIASAIVTAYLSWRMRDLISFSTFDAVLLTTALVLAPPLVADRAGRSPRAGTRAVLVMFLLVIALAYASLVAQYLTEHAGPHPWVVAAMLTYASAGGATLLYMRARP